MAVKMRSGRAPGMDLEREALLSQMRGGPTPEGLPAAAPGQVMHGNQPGVARATGGTMSVTTDTSKVGGERYQVQNGGPADGGAMKILDRHPSERAAGEAAYRSLYGRDPGASDYHQWTDPFPGVPQSSGGTGNLADMGSGAATGAVPVSGKFRGSMKGFNDDKFGNEEHTTPKYQIARTLQNFDPAQGVTPELLAALNALGIGTFSGQKDKVHVSGAVDPRFEGYTTIDLVEGFNNPNGTKSWQYGAINPNAPAEQASAAPAAAAGGYGGPSSTSAINALFPSDMSTHQTLEQRLQEILGGASALDRRALLSMMTR
jgi:hypothetical protein